MGIVSVSNDGKTDMVVAGRVILPGETRHFDPRDVPLALRPESDVGAREKPPEPVDPMQTLLGESVIIIKEAIPNLEGRELVELCRLEEASVKPRSTLLAAIGEDQLRRASENP